MTARASILNVNLMLLALLKPCTGCPLLCPQHLKPSLSALLLLSKTCSPILWLTHSPAPLALATLISQLADQGLNICFLNLEDFPPLLAYSCSTLAPPPPIAHHPSITVLENPALTPQLVKDLYHMAPETSVHISVLIMLS